MVRRLKLLDDPTDSLPSDSLRVAFASSDMRCVDQHFGAAEAFVIYAVAGREGRKVEAIQFTGTAARDGNEGKLAARLSAVAGCDAVYAEAIGPSAKTQLAARNVQAFCVPSGTPILDILTALHGGSSGGLIAALRRHRDPDRFEAIAAEGWSE